MKWFKRKPQTDDVEELHNNILNYKMMFNNWKATEVLYNNIQLAYEKMTGNKSENLELISVSLDDDLKTLIVQFRNKGDIIVNTIYVYFYINNGTIKPFACQLSKRDRTSFWIE